MVNHGSTERQEGNDRPTETTERSFDWGPDQGPIPVTARTTKIPGDDWSAGTPDSTNSSEYRPDIPRKLVSLFSAVPYRRIPIIARNFDTQFPPERALTLRTFSTNLNLPRAPKPNIHSKDLLHAI
ncbi:hypothetical protein TNCV_2140501 [Trichonephila clavipes]|uniref:Uncharacterized protein n=1 Tax=Trichonephila clavipes TaxID=2585209 RepID=A0A8X6RU48_TRICX|nr:hypothetical protein TNCV_2140501 [Trichonephila clavipes]